VSWPCGKRKRKRKRERRLEKGREREEGEERSRGGGHGEEERMAAPRAHAPGAISMAFLSASDPRESLTVPPLLLGILLV
jgi:hypothetical protein